MANMDCPINLALVHPRAEAVSGWATISPSGTVFHWGRGWDDEWDLGRQTEGREGKW